MEANPNNHESIQTPNIAWLFDIDGVITNPTEKEITEPKILDELLSRLQKNEPIALVSGRAISWIERVVLDKIVNLVDDPKKLDNLFVSAEFGAISISFSDGEKVKQIDHEELLPADITEKASHLIREEYSEIAFVDEEKEAQFTAEMNKGISVDDFRQKQKEFSEKFKKIVEELGDETELEVHVDRIATNIKNKKLNKYFAAKGVLEWMKSNRINPKKFIVFGDSLTDIEMAREISSTGANVSFVFVGDDKIPDEKFEVIKQGGVDKGTLRYLKETKD